MTYGPIGPIVITMSLGRPQEFNYEKVLDAATELFWRNGFESTSMSELLSATGLSKSSLYQSFGGKSELFQKCLENYSSSMTRQLLDNLSRAESGITFIEALLNSAAEEAGGKLRPKGCLIMNTATEFSRKDTAVLGYVEKGISEFKRIFSLALAKAQSKNEIPQEKDINQLSSYLVGVMSGIRAMVKGGISEDEAKVIIKIAVHSLM
ncbi:MAG: TetR/AcrR family transcriptional regulator [Bdellovibrio sp.]